MQSLTEKFQKELLSENFSPIKKSDMNTMAVILEQQEKAIDAMLKEGTTASDIAGFTKILMPLVRRVYPNLIANEIAGVQPLAGPTGFIYAMTSSYTGNGINGIAPSPKKQIVVVSKAEGDALTIAGKVIYKESAVVDGVDVVKVLWNDTTAVANGTNTISDGTHNAVILDTYSNEATFNRVLKGYTGPYVTAAGEKLGEDMNEIGFELRRKSVEAQTRKLKGKYTLEMYQDLKSQHQLNADEELMGIMSYEMQAEIDREIINRVNSTGRVATDATIGGYDGRWEIEKYRILAIKLADEAAKIGRLTRRGAGNTLLVSPKVSVVLEALGGFSASGVQSTVDGMSTAVAGTFDGRYKVVVDTFAENDYATVLYKGQDRRDSAVFFSPYVPATFQRITLQESGQPAIILSQRYAVDTTPLNPENFISTFGVDFTAVSGKVSPLQ